MQIWCTCSLKDGWWAVQLSAADYKLELAAVRNIYHQCPMRSRSFKVTEFGANREPVYDFLLVINSNLGPISHRYW